MVFISFFLIGQSNYEWDSIIVSEYSINIEHFSDTLKLKKNRNFHYKRRHITCFNSNEFIEEYLGNYKIKGNQIIFEATHYIDSAYMGDYFHSDTLPYLKENYDFHDTLYIIPWNDEIYLLGNKSTFYNNDEIVLNRFYNNDFVSFINDINSGEFLSNFYWNKKYHLEQPIPLSESIPSPWNSFLMESPIEATILKVKPFHRTPKIPASTIIIDKGSEDSIKVGMQLYAIEEDKCPCYIEIYEVNKKRSKGFIRSCMPYDCLKNTKISTQIQSAKK